MSRIAREHPDDPESWQHPVVIPPTPRRCRCSHARITHTRREGQCWSGLCACREYRPEEKA